jgi:hypothetical protein
MPNIRIGFGTDFNLKNEQIGIGLTNQSVRLQVAGNIRAERLITTGSGINTFYSYDGFLNDKQESNYDLSIDISDKGNLNSLSGEIVINGEVTVSEDTPLTGGRLDSLTVTGKFDLPQGGTEDREDTPEKGSTRFNQDLGQLEFYTGYEWRTVNSYADSGGRGRGVFNLGFFPATTQIDFINISTLGNAQDFGNTSIVRGISGSCSSSIRGLFSSGYTPGGNTNSIDYITIASQGNSIDFGDGTIIREELCGCSSSTRGLFAGSGPSGIAVNTIDYVTIASLGDAKDFGDLTIGRSDPTGISSPTRGFVCGGYSPGPSRQRTIDTFIISSTGNAVSFGNLTETFSRGNNGSISSGTRGILGGGFSSSNRNIIEYITLNTFGNAQDFGDLTVIRSRLGSTSNVTRGIFCGGETPSILNVIDYVTITTTGNAQDFGDLTRVGDGIAGLSDSHGGLGGF